jgi:hypothetical protein
MNAIIQDAGVEAWPSSLAPTTLVLNADATVGWKTEAQRLAFGAKLRASEPRQ